MNESFNQVKDFLYELDYNIVSENEEEHVLVISKEDDGINNMVLVCDEPILIIEQFLLDVNKEDLGFFKKLLVKNRDIIHGAFAFNEEGDKLLFRDTLQLENLDRNELEGTLNSFSVLLSEFSDELIDYAKN